MNDEPKGYAAMLSALGMLAAMDYGSAPGIVVIRRPRPLPPEVSIKDDKRKRKQWLQRQSHKKNRSR